MTFVAFFFGFAALGMFVVAFNHVVKGRIGAAVLWGVMALIMCSITSAVAVYGID
jgi:hypothetical protein